VGYPWPRSAFGFNLYFVPLFILGPLSGSSSDSTHPALPTPTLQLHARIRELGRHFKLRVLLTLVDVKDSEKSLLDLSRLCIAHDMTLMLAWNNQEAGRYLETYKVCVVAGVTSAVFFAFVCACVRMCVGHHTLVWLGGLFLYGIAECFG